MGLFDQVPITFWFALTFFASICAFALWQGGREERIVGAILVLTALASPLLKDHQWRGVQWGFFATDTLQLVVMCWVALTSKRWWPLFAAAFQLLAILTHAASMVDRSLGSWAYITAGVIWAYGMLFSVLVGTINTVRGRTRRATRA